MISETEDIRDYTEVPETHMVERLPTPGIPTF